MLVLLTLCTQFVNSKTLLKLQTRWSWLRIIHVLPSASSHSAVQWWNLTGKLSRRTRFTWHANTLYLPSRRFKFIVNRTCELFAKGWVFIPKISYDLKLVITKCSHFGSWFWGCTSSSAAFFKAQLLRLRIIHVLPSSSRSMMKLDR